MKKIFYLSIATSIFLSSCKKDENSPNPTSTTKTDITLSDLYAKEGFIKGTITSKTSSNEAISKSFNFELVDESSFEINPNGGDTIYTIKIGRLDASSSVTQSYNNYCFLEFTIAKDKSTLIRLNRFDLQTDIKKENINVTRFNADFYYQSHTNAVNATTMKLSNVKFNPSTGMIAADYVVSLGATDNESGKAATVAGSFSSKNISIMFRKASL
jgi:hypothetical protein